MPKIIDHDARRKLIVETYLRLVAERGVQHATAKSICAELGTSTGSLWHYFRSFDDVVDQAVLSVFERDVERVEHLTERGLAGVCVAIEALLPLDPTTRVEADLIVAFWGQTAQRAHLRGHMASTEVFSAVLRRVVAEAVADGDLRSDTPVEILAEALNQLLDGAQVSHALDPDLPNSRRLARMAALIVPWLTPRDSAAAGQLHTWLTEDAVDRSTTEEEVNS